MLRTVLAGMSLRDLRLALRALAQAPGFTLIAVLTLALGIGASASIFSVVDAVLLRPLPFPQPQQLLSVRERDRQFPSMSVSFPDYLSWVQGQHSFSSLAAYRGTGAILTHAGPPAIINGQDASAAYFAVLGVQPELGRTFSAAEDRVGAPNVVVLADTLWRQRFNGDRHILGRAIELDGKPRTVIGVMPPGFPGLDSPKDAPQFWVPLGAEATAASGLMHRGSHPGLNGVGRLKPGVTLALARADLEGIARALALRYPKSNTGESVVVQPYLNWVIRNAGAPELWLLLGAVGLVLLIACANVANLLLARSATRQKANAIRAALGASRARLAREHLNESLCLSLTGGALGLGLAWSAMRVIPAVVPQGMVRADQVRLDPRVLGFTLALTLLTTLVFGIVPAWQASRARLADVLKQGGRDSSSASAGRWRNALAAAEMALALLLLAGAGLLIRSLVKLQQVAPGFRPDHVLTFGISLPPATYPAAAQSAAFFRQARLRLRQLPGVTEVGSIYPLPFSGNDWEEAFTVAGRPAPPPGQEPSTNYAMVAGDYLPAIGMRLLRGRAFTPDDTAQSPPVVMIDDSFARKYWPGPDPLDAALGKQVRMDGKDRTVVGVFARVKDYGLDSRDTLPELFVPQPQGGDPNDAYLTLRVGQADPLALAAEAKAVIQAIDPDEPLYDVQSMNQRIAASLAQQRLTLWLMAAFAALALLLAAIGIYGVLSYAIAQRTQELGVRMALGAGRGQVLRLVLGQGLRLAGTGALLGLAAALALGRFAHAFLFGVNAADPLTLTLVPLVLLAVAALACYLPARRATRVDPLVALRGD